MNTRPTDLKTCVAETEELDRNRPAEIGEWFFFARLEHEIVGFVAAGSLSQQEQSNGEKRVVIALPWSNDCPLGNIEGNILVAVKLQKYQVETEDQGTFNFFHAHGREPMTSTQVCTEQLNKDGLAAHYARGTTNWHFI